MQATRIAVRSILALAFALSATAAAAQQRPSYGPTVNLEAAKKMAVTAAAEARRNGWPVAIAIVDNHGMLIYYEMMDDTQTSSATIAIEKAKTAAMFRRPSKAFEDAVAGGRQAILGLPGVTPIDGGLPIMVLGECVGGVGVSGAAAAEDEQVAQAGIDALGT